MEWKVEVYLPLRKRFFEKSTVLIVLIGFQFAALGIAQFFWQGSMLLVALAAMLLVVLINGLIFYWRSIFFLQKLEITEQDQVILNFFQGDQPQSIKFPLKDLELKYDINMTKGHYTRIGFFQADKKIGTLYNNSLWSHKKLTDLFIAVKKRKKEEIHPYDQKKIDAKGIYG